MLGVARLWGVATSAITQPYPLDATVLPHYLHWQHKQLCYRSFATGTTTAVGTNVACRGLAIELSVHASFVTANASHSMTACTVLRQRT